MRLRKSQGPTGPAGVIGGPAGAVGPSICEAAGGTGHGWEVTLYYRPGYADQPWCATLWENGVRRGHSISAETRNEAIESARVEKQEIIRKRDGIDRPKVVAL
jgi:hypothetical protein